MIGRADDSGQTVYRKHQKRCFSHHGKVTGKKRVQSGPDDFQAPACKTAQKKILLLHTKTSSRKQIFHTHLTWKSIFNSIPCLEKNIRVVYNERNTRGRRNRQ